MATSSSTSASTSSALVEAVAPLRVESRRTISPYDLSFGDNSASQYKQALVLRNSPITSSVSCSECGRTGHISENCFHKIGYPYWWTDKSRTKPGSNFSKGNSQAARGAHTTFVGSMKSKGTYHVAHVNHVAAPNSGFTWVMDLAPQLFQCKQLRLQMQIGLE
ncbi:unnamed protein product [Arabidopsis halleri]